MYDQIKKINASLNTVDIKGKQYIPVNERVKAFAMLDLEADFDSEIIKDDGTEIIIRAVVNVKGVGKRTAHASEIRGSSNINRFSALENCETSAYGRALGLFAIGIETSIASYEEVANAQMNQEGNKLATAIEKAGLVASANAKGMDIEELLKLVGFDRNKQPEGMTAKQYGKAMYILNGGI